MKDKVLFYAGKYYIFSNFSAHAIKIYGHLFMTSEHVYQYKRFDQTSKKACWEILRARSPLAAKKISRLYEKFVRKDWDEVKVEIMTEIIDAKYVQHEEVRKALEQTRDLEIAENSPEDYFWGVGVDGTGRNELGKIWMKIREKYLQKHQATTKE